MAADVVVLGAGFAGLSAAVALASKGRRVLVLEEGPRLGGRATAFTDRETGERVDNGQHVLFGCYRDTYSFLTTIGAAAKAPLQPTLSLTMASDTGRRATLRCPSWPAPWHLVGGLMRWSALGTGDRLSALRLGPLLRSASRQGAEAVAARVPSGQTASDWLRAARQTKAICDWLWHPLIYAALNQPPEVAAAQPFVRVLGELFGPRPTDAAIGLPAVPLDELYAEPARTYLEARGGEVRLRTRGRVVVGEGDRVAAVVAGEERIETKVAISAVPWFGFSRIWEGAVPDPMRGTESRAAAMRRSPIVTVNLWLDAPAVDDTFIGRVGGPMHWIFNKSAMYGDRTAHLSIVSSGADAIAAMTNDEITRTTMDQIQRALPDTRARRVLRAVVVREQRATFSLAPGAPQRPRAETPIRGLYLAGDWTDTGLPGTIEGAVKSGHVAANLALTAR